MENNSLKYRHLTSEEIFDYQNQKLSSSEMHRIEMHLQGCSFCDEAMNGVSKMDDSLKTINIMRDLRKKGRSKFNHKKRVFDLVDINSILIILLLIGLLVFISLFIFKLK